ncbi:hypothetical protein [Asanoa sp. NPDC050611]|uniref:hypothetical protein n=1 Tax=Asanoa sp. NPDC050611 TaxID=3157098 RepID=UPI0033D95B61
MAEPVGGNGIEALPIVPPGGTNPAPSQTGTEATDRAGVPIITGLDTVAGPATVPAASGDGALSGVATGEDTMHGRKRPADDGPATGGAKAGSPQAGSPQAGGAQAGSAQAGSAQAGSPQAGGIAVDQQEDEEDADAGGAVSVERLPTRLSVNKARHAAAAQSGIFRLGDLHSDARTMPDNSHMLGICAWGTALALAGVGVGIRGLAAIIGGSAPAWYKPALIGVGVIGVLLTVGAFVTIQRRYLPWLLLAFATLPLAVTIALTIIAL